MASRVDPAQADGQSGGSLAQSPRPEPSAALAPPASQRRPPAPRTRAPRRTPTRNADFDHLDLDALRGYRTELAAEESRVSYWRRIMQARLDLLVTRDAQPPGSERIRAVLADARLTSARVSIVQTVPSDDVPPLPDLAALWAESPTPGDPVHAAELLTALAAAEQELSLYRRSLHARIDAATAELIARYHENPSLCLVALPLAGKDRLTTG